MRRWKNSQFASWKEWKSVRASTYVILIIGLITLIISFCIISYGSYIGEEMIKGR